MAIADSLANELQLYIGTTKDRLRAHREAMACYRFEDVLARGVQVFHLITNVDEAWRAEVIAGQLAFDAADGQRILDAYATWLRPCAGMLERLDYFERCGFEVRHAQEFRQCAREAQGLLTPDAEFFTADALAALRDAALDEHRAGQTLDFPAP